MKMSQRQTCFEVIGKIEQAYKPSTPSTNRSAQGRVKVMFSFFRGRNVDFFRGLDIQNLSLDEAYVLSNQTLYGIEDDCRGCPLRDLTGERSNNSYALSTKHGWTFRLGESYRNEEDGCTFNASLEPFGVYRIRKCSLETLLPPVNPYLPLLFYALFFLVLYLFIKFLVPVLKRRCSVAKENREKEEDERSKTNRIHSLDTFRGFSIALMIFVNDGGGGYYFMEHATWNGLYVADLAFPWFMWIMGFCIPLSLKRNKARFFAILLDITRRSAVLFILGLVWGNYGLINLETCRIPGVLQRFGFCYFVVGIVCASSFSCQAQIKVGILRDVRSYWMRWIIALMLVLTHTVIIFSYTVPGCPTGYLGPGGADLKEDHDCIGGVTGYLDRLVFTPSHIYSNPTAKAVYGTTTPFDPEGLLGSLTSAFQVLLGVQGGITFLTVEGKKEKLIRLFVWGILTSIGGAGLAGFGTDYGIIPVNKNLWSLSFVLLTSGFAFILLAMMYFAVDVVRVWSGSPFLYAGMNPIVLYLGHITAWKMLPFHFVVGPMNTHFLKLTEALWGVCLWLIIARILYKKQIFIKV